MERKITDCKLLTVFVFVIFILLNQILHSQSFAPLGTGANGSAIHSIIEYNGELIVGGDFTSINGILANRIARWNGFSWAPLGEGFKGGSVYALAVYQGELYAAGSIISAGQTEVNRIAKWNGVTWSPLGIGADDEIRTLAVHDNALYVGGSFINVGGINANYIAKWSGGGWSPVGTGTNGPINALISTREKLYIGGEFTAIGGIPVNMIASWNGSNWNLVGNGIVNGTAVYSFEILERDLIVGGRFTNIGGVSVNNIARWDGSSYSSISDGLSGDVRSLKVFLGDLYVGGEFTGAVGGSSVSSITKWDGSTFTPLNSGCNSNVLTLGSYDKNLIAGGTFIIAGGLAVNRITKWGKRPNAPVLESPSNASSIAGLTPSFKWITLKDASDYRLQVSSDPNFSSLVLDVSDLLDNRYNMPSGLLDPETVYFWRVNGRNGMGEGPFSNIFYFSSIVSGIGNTSGEIPETYNLYGNYPNPFNPSTKIKFDIPAEGLNSNTKLIVYDAMGREVATLLNTTLQPGTYELDFNASNLSSGLYFFTLITDKFVNTKKMVLLK